MTKGIWLKHWLPHYLVTLFSYGRNIHYQYLCPGPGQSLTLKKLLCPGRAGHREVSSRSCSDQVGAGRGREEMVIPIRNVQEGFSEEGARELEGEYHMVQKQVKAKELI